jgi:hexokinase
MAKIFNYRQIAENFQNEIKTAAKGKTTSLPFIVHRLSPTPLVKDGEKFQVLKIGGSICQNALVYKNGQEIIVESLEEEHLPIFATGKSLLALVKSHLRKNIKVLALNFAFQIKPVFENNRLDGILTRPSKEHSFTGLVGKQVGAEIEKFIKLKFNKQIIVTLANDTICLTLSGLGRAAPLGLAGGIVGTGMNFAFFLDEQTLVNLESANFNRFPPSAAGLAVDAHSIKPGEALFEKEVSGAYLFQNYNLRRGKEFVKIESTHQMDKVARGEISGDKLLARELFVQSAELISCQIAGITNFKKRDMVFVMEGSLFWAGYNYWKTVEETVKSLTKYKVKFKEIKDCGIVGAAQLAV